MEQISGGDKGEDVETIEIPNVPIQEKIETEKEWEYRHQDVSNDDWNWISIERKVSETRVQQYTEEGTQNSSRRWQDHVENDEIGRCTSRVVTVKSL